MTTLEVSHVCNHICVIPLRRVPNYLYKPEPHNKISFNRMLGCLLTVRREGFLVRPGISQQTSRANCFAFESTSLVSVFLSTLLPFANGWRSVLLFHSCSRCKFPKITGTDESVTRTYKFSSICMPRTGASQRSCSLILNEV